MQQIPLGSQGLTTFPLGLGCMGMSAFYGGATESGSVETIRRALDLGITLFGPGPGQRGVEVRQRLR